MSLTEDSVDNLKLLCRAHNRLRVEVELGIEHVAKAIARRRRDAYAQGVDSADE